MQDIEKLATKKGVISQSVKEVLQVCYTDNQPANATNTDGINRQDQPVIALLSRA